MTTEILFSSNKVDVTDQQLQSMLDRFNLGRLISSERPTNGVMGQTIFVSSTGGEFVLKGNPLYEGQFVEEKFFVENLHQRTKIRVPSPYLVDESEDIFGWSYALMPRLPGVHFHKPEIHAKLTNDEKIRIAKLLAETLSEMHSWITDQCGEFDPKRQTIRPFEGSYKTWIYHRIRYWLEDARKYSVITSQDVEWVEEVLESSQHAFENLSSFTFVMSDFKPDNFLLQYGIDGWEFSAVFDFTTAYFGDPIADLPRMIGIYMERGEEELARCFLSTYLYYSGDQEAFVERLRVHMLQQCVLDWGCAWAIDNVTWDKDLSFSNWARRFTDSVSDLVS